MHTGNGPAFCTVAVRVVLGLNMTDDLWCCYAAHKFDMLVVTPRLW